MAVSQTRNPEDRRRGRICSLNQGRNHSHGGWIRWHGVGRTGLEEGVALDDVGLRGHHMPA
jgi:hypothetical protein